MEKYYLEDRILYKNEKDDLLAEIDFPMTGENEITITHTFVDDSLRGMGIAKELVESVLAHAKKNGLTVRATCSYAKHYFEKNPDAFYKAN